MSSGKVVVFLCAICGVLSMVNVRANAPWFQQFLNQGNNQLGLINNNINNNNNGLMVGLMRGKLTRCNGTGTDSQIEGTCLSRKECRRQGGSASGTCNFIGSCCLLQQTCGNDTIAKVSYFTSPRQFQEFCPFRIRLYNRNVCQIRLDFERFNIQGVPNAGSIWECSIDRFVVNGAGNLGFPALCGDNMGQHIYVPVNSTLGVGEITLNFDFQSNRTGLSVAVPDWRIKVTQLECGLGNDDSGKFQSSLTNLYMNHNDRRNSGVRDNDLIAPPGCLQYYPEPQGTYTSFNFNGGRGPMIANCNYAICFKRNSNSCGISHTGVFFLMSGNPDQPADAQCTIDQNVPGTGNDWLLIPGGVTSTGTLSDYYCLDQLQSETVTSRTPGPQYVVVNTDAIQSSLPETGFRVNYNILSQC